ncbi:MAG: purine-nucleoside phosphorylase [Planctomycetota bacterium]
MIGASASVQAASVKAATDFLRGCWSAVPQVAVVLGSGLSQLPEWFHIDRSVSYSEIPGFPAPTAVGHRGRLLLGYYQKIPLVALDGRCHRYEGHAFETITLPVRAIAGWGAKRFVISNASGGLNPRLAAADVLVMRGHLNWMGAIPYGHSLSGSPYDSQLIELALATARAGAFPAWQGIYAGVSGPNYETRAEYRFLRRLGADVVGMSTIPEVLALAEQGCRVLGLSIVTNVAKPDVAVKTTADEVLATAATAAARLWQIIGAVVQDATRL